MNEHNLKIERRRVPRYKVALPARFRFPDLKRPLTYDALTGDIGEGGLFIERAFKESEVGKTIDIELQVPESHTVIKFTGSVAWIKRSIQEHTVLGLGVRLAEVLPEEKRKLDHCLAHSCGVLTPKIKSLRRPDFKLSDREHRSLEILDTLRRHSPASKTTIAQEIDLNIVTISNYIDDFKRKGIVFERGLDESSGGRRPSLLELNARYGFFIGAEVNLLAGYTRVLVADFVLRFLVTKTVQRTHPSRGVEPALVDMISEAVRDSDIDRGKIVGIGIGLAGSPAGYAATLRDSLKERVGLPVLIEDAGTANIFAEKWFNLDLVKKESIIYAGVDSMGPGSDFSMILRGAVFRGAAPAKPAAWTNPARDDGKKDAHYCWMQQTCLMQREAAPVSAGNASEMGLRYGVRIAHLINLLQPEAVVVSAPEPAAQAAFFEALHAAVRRWASDDTARSVKIIPAQMKEDSVAAGMAALVCRDAYCQA